MNFRHKQAQEKPARRVAPCRPIRDVRSYAATFAAWWIRLPAIGLRAPRLDRDGSAANSASTRMPGTSRRISSRTRYSRQGPSASKRWCNACRRRRQGLGRAIARSQYGPIASAHQLTGRLRGQVVPEAGQEMTLVDIPEIVPQAGGGILGRRGHRGPDRAGARRRCLSKVLAERETRRGLSARLRQRDGRAQRFSYSPPKLCDRQTRSILLAYCRFGGQCQTLAVNAFTAHASPGARWSSCVRLGHSAKPHTQSHLSGIAILLLAGTSISGSVPIAFLIWNFSLLSRGKGIRDAPEATAVVCQLDGTGRAQQIPDVFLDTCKQQ
jgi:hypothetical protein